MRGLLLPLLWIHDVFFSFDGRLGVFQGFWRGMILILPFALTSFAFTFPAFRTPPGSVLALAGLLLFWTLSVIGGISLVVRRLHDHGVGGHEAWKLCFPFTMRSLTLQAMLLTQGPMGTNKYGAQPKGLLGTTPVRRTDEG